jgi:hypothetical protein
MPTTEQSSEVHERQAYYRAAVELQYERGYAAALQDVLLAAHNTSWGSRAAWPTRPASASTGPPIHSIVQVVTASPACTAAASPVPRAPPVSSQSNAALLGSPDCIVAKPRSSRRCLDQAT